MFRAKTVIVVGAGASVEVGLPVGTELLKQIVNLTNITFDFGRQKTGDEAIIQALRNILNEGREVTKINQHIHAAWQLGKSATQAISIDNVIDALEDDKTELVGKLGIVRAILLAEAKSAKFRVMDRQPYTVDLARFEDTWYGSLTKLLTENVRKSEVSKVLNNLEIINFNYDRCLEHYLSISLSEYYGLHVDEITSILKNLIVHRPYGMAGKLPWQNGEGPIVGFGQNSPHIIASAAQQIRTFTERVEEGEQLSAMKRSIAVADRIVFLGFAFHRQNVELLAQKVQPHTEIVATAYRISKNDRSVIESELKKAFSFDRDLIGGAMNEWRITLADSTCSQFFKDYWRTLTAEKSY